MWLGNKQYNDIASYDCGLHARAVDIETGDRVNTIVSACMWDKQWNYTRHTGCECEEKKMCFGITVIGHFVFVKSCH